MESQDFQWLEMHVLCLLCYRGLSQTGRSSPEAESTAPGLGVGWRTALEMLSLRVCAFFFEG